MKTAAAMNMILLSALATLSLADNCDTRYKYCGSSLLNKGNYAAQIDQALEDAGYPAGTDGDNFLFRCVGGPNGDIAIIENCSLGCHDAGAGNSDYCE